MGKPATDKTSSRLQGLDVDLMEEWRPSGSLASIDCDQAYN